MLGQTIAGTNSRLDAAALRDAFDRGFAEAPAAGEGEPVDLLAIRLGGDPFAIRLSEASGLFADRRITPLPGPVREFRGLAGLRGALVPVFDLAALIGYPPAAAPRWLLTARDRQIAFAIEIFDGQLRAMPDDLVAHEASSAKHVREIVRASPRSRQIVDLPSLVAAVTKQTPDPVDRKEP